MPSPFADPLGVVPLARAPRPIVQVSLGDLTEQEVSGASRRLRALAALSGSLTDSLNPEDAADLVEQQALSALGATSAIVMTLGHFPPAALRPATSAASAASVPATTLNVVHAIALPAQIRATLEHLPLEAAVPLAEVARTGEPLFLPSEETLRLSGEWGVAMMEAGARAAAIVPVWANGELRGVLGLAWPIPRVFDEDERAFVLTLGVMCAQAIMRAHLRTAELHAREAAEEANRSKTLFLATVSHELRTPMSAVIGYAHLLADEIDGPVSALQKDRLGRIQTSGKHLLGLIEVLLDYARLEGGQEVVCPEAVHLVDVLEDSLVVIRPLAEQRGLAIRIESPAEPITLHTDARKLRQILVNLLANAVKFTDAGDILVRIRITGQNAEAGLSFEVTDTGRGIAIEDHEHIFEPFWRGGSPLTRTSDGTGLGLSLARQLARLLGGEVIVAKSAVSHGSTFVASIPARYVDGGR